MLSLKNKGLSNESAYRKNVELVEYRLKGPMGYQKNTLSVIRRTKIWPNILGFVFEQSLLCRSSIVGRINYKKVIV